MKNISTWSSVKQNAFYKYRGINRPTIDGGQIELFMAAGS